MTTGNIIGAHEDADAKERVLRIERNWQSLFGKRTKTRFWPDVEVRRFLILQHGFMTLDMAHSRLICRVGVERTPSRTAIGRFWAKLDALEARK